MEKSYVSKVEHDCKECPSTTVDSSSPNTTNAAVSQFTWTTTSTFVSLAMIIKIMF